LPDWPFSNGRPRTRPGGFGVGPSISPPPCSNRRAIHDAAPGQKYATPIRQLFDHYYRNNTIPFAHSIALGFPSPLGQVGRPLKPTSALGSRRERVERTGALEILRTLIYFARYGQCCPKRAEQHKLMDGIPSIKHYDRGDRLHVQAQRIWLILVAFVMSPTRKPGDPKTITYGEVAELMRYPDRRAGHMLNRQLGIIGEYCRLNGLPALNSIVVNQTTGVPGDEVLLRDGRTVKEEQRAVMTEDWFALRIPTTGTLRKVWDSVN